MGDGFLVTLQAISLFNNSLEKRVDGV